MFIFVSKKVKIYLYDAKNLSAFLQGFL